MHPLLSGEHARLRMEQLTAEAALARHVPPAHALVALRQSLGLGLVRAGMRLLVRMPEPERPPSLAG